MEATGTTPYDYRYAVFHQPNGKFPMRVGKMLGFKREQLGYLFGDQAPAVESANEFVNVRGEEVGVAVDGYCDRGVTEVGLDGFGVGTGGDEEAGAGVAEVVDAQTLGESGLFDGRVPDAPPEVAVSEWCAVRRGEHEGCWVVWDVAGEVVGEQVVEESGDADDTAAVVLGGPVVELATDF